VKSGAPLDMALWPSSGTSGPGDRTDRTTEPTVSDPWLGRTFAGCTLDARITASSSAHLFRATREVDGTRVSVAVVHPSRHRELASPERVSATFGRLGGDLPPGVPPLLDCIRVDGQLVVVMAALQGETLETTVRRGPLSGSAVAQLASELADVLSFLHRRGVVHGGLTPARVLMTPVGARLLEVGVAPMGRSHTDDVRAFGSCLAVAAAGPQAVRHLGPIAALHPMLPPWLAGLIDDCRLGDATRMPADGLVVQQRVAARLEPLLTRSSGAAPPAPPPVRTALAADVSVMPPKEEVFGRPTDPDGAAPPPAPTPTPAPAPGPTPAPVPSPGPGAPAVRHQASPPSAVPAPEVPEPAPSAAESAEEEPPPKPGFDAKEAVLGLSFGIGSGLVIFGAIYGVMLLLTGGLGSNEAEVAPEPVAADAAPTADAVVAEDTASEAEDAPTWPIEVVNGGGQILHLACAWDGESMGEEVPLLDGESWSGQGAMVGSTCSALEPASGEALWTWTAASAPDSDAGFALQIPPIPKAAPEPTRRSTRRKTAPEPAPAPPPPKVEAPQEEPVEELVKLRIVPGAKRKKKQEGVGVRVDGRKVGNAPVTVDMLDPGGHRIEATWEGKSVKCVVKVMSGTVTVSVDPAGGKCAKQ